MFIVAPDIHKEPFKNILNDRNYKYDTFLIYNIVCRLSWVISLESFVNCLDEIHL